MNNYEISPHQRSARFVKARRLWYLAQGLLLLIGTLGPTRSMAKPSVYAAVFIANANARGGTGDITSNIVTAIRLKQTRPDWQVTLILPEKLDSEAIVRSALPERELKILLSDIPLISRDEFYRLKDSIKADMKLAMQFSTTDVEKFDSRGWADREWYFSEFSMPEYRWQNEIKPLQEVGRFSAGPDTLGIYITPSKPAAMQTRGETTHTLSLVSEKTQIGTTDLSGPFKLAYSYATHPHHTRKYLSYIYRNALKHPGERIHVVAYDADRGNIDYYSRDLPQNVRLTLLHKRPLSLGFNLIAHADLPVLLTGDFGPNVAIDYEKPFFMETHPHKEAFRDAFIAKFARHLDTQEMHTLRKMMHFHTLELADMEIDNKSFWRKFTRSIGNFRSQISLPETIAHQIESDTETADCLQR